VISPEGCASILWKSASRASEAAEAMGITSQRLKLLNLIDQVIPEPLGGAHRDVETTITTVKQALVESLARLDSKRIDDLLKTRYQRIMSYGVFKG
jgi:acetyl-CoA carboxylase carboxyl transferase subunit alpha